MFQLMIVANLLLLFCKYGECEQVYIIPSVDTPCPAQACYTLMQYINYTSLCHSPNSSNIALIFMPGNHILGTEFPIANKSCFSMSAYSYNTSSSCSVMCNSSSRMTLSSIETVVISGISFTNCGGNTARFVDSFILKDLNFIMDPPSYIVSSYYDIVYTIILYRRRAWSVIGSETLSIDSCTFTTNTASYRGGALYISAVTNVIITLCTFNNNIAGGGGGKGGAMYISAINCIINGSTFFNNTLQGGGAKGGAVYVNAMNSTIYMSIFINNIVRGGSAKGGAIFITATNSVISRATFTNNTARGGSAKGGAISITATNSVISRATFTNNTARGGGAQGGALYVKATSSIIGMSTFINNSATHGAPRYIIANPSIISDDAVYEGIQWQDLNFNTTLSNEICGENSVLV